LRTSNVDLLDPRRIHCSGAMCARSIQPPHGEAYAAAAGPEPSKSGKARGLSLHPGARRGMLAAEDRTPIKVVFADDALAAESRLLCRGLGAATAPARTGPRGITPGLRS
jgi:hypothetical protein